MKTIIHIGQHKTGTTSIQKFLQDKRSHFLSRGLYVPLSIAGFDHPSHFILNVYALAQNRCSPMKEQLIRTKGKCYLTDLKAEIENDIERIYQDAQRKKCHTILWSNEGLYLLNSLIEYEKLKNLFSKYSSEVEVVCCFRDIDSYTKSYIKQITKTNKSLSNSPDSYRYVKPDSWLFDYKRKKELLNLTFDKCSYFPYDSNDNVRKFMEAIGFNTLNTDAYRLNASSVTI